jgi:plastocyanin
MITKRVGWLALLAATPLLSASADISDVAVDQKGLRFTKSEVSVAVGASVHFHNSDDVTHNIMTIDETDEPEDHGLQKPGEIISAKFDRAGDYQVRCAIHPKMKMSVKVGRQ